MTSRKTLSLALLTAFLFFMAPADSIAKKEKAEKPSERAILHNNAGVTALYQGDTEKAIFEFRTATELSPNYVEAWNNLGLGYKFKGKMELAIEALKRAIELDKKYASPYNHLGAIYFELGRHSEALEQFEKAVHTNKSFSDAYFNKGITLAAMGHERGDKKKLQEATHALVKATTLNAEHPYAHYELAKIYQELDQKEQAIIRYKLALEINPKLTEGWVSLASLYNQTGETLKAQQALNRAMVETPGSPSVHLNLGLAYLREKNYTLALKEFDLAIQKMPANELAYFNAGFTHFQIGMEAKNSGNASSAQNSFDQSLKAYESALKIKPNFSDAAYNIAFTYQTMNDIPNAIRYYQKTLAIDPNHGRAQFTLGELFEHQGDTKNAALYYCQFLKSSRKDIEVDVNKIKQMVTQWGGCK